MSPSEPAPRPAAVQGGEPDGEVLAAIVAAVEMSWPRPAPAVEEEPSPAVPWRFSGRWWVGRRPRAVSRRR